MAAGGVGGRAEMTVLRAAAETHTGYVRSTNQDLALVSGDLVAVADGMGGHLGGEVAARTAIEELLETFRRDRTGDGFVTAARRANRAVWRKSRVDRTLHGMGTTLTAAALVRRPRRSEPPGGGGEERGEGVRDVGLRLILINVGDSRAYLLDGTTRQLRQLTEDHSVVEEMVRQGELTPEEAAVHPHRHVLTRALGIEPEVALDIWDLDAELGSRFLLCSDGLTNELPDAEIADILARSASPDEAVGELVGRALGHGGMDNVTVVVADVVDSEADPVAVPVQLVPPGPSLPEDPVMGTPELTEAIPITEPPHPDERDPSPGPALATGAAGVVAGGGDPVSGGAAVGAAAEAGARDLDAGAASGPDTDATSSIDEAASSAESERADEEGVPSGPRHRAGRSMTVRQGGPAPSIDGTVGERRAGRAAATLAGGWPPASGSDLDGPAGAPSRSLLLVPQRRVRASSDRIVTVRVVLFIVALAGLLVGTVGVVIWYDESSYFVGLNGNDVAIYEGRPGGLLWLKPQLVETSEIRTSELLRSSIAVLRGGITESSLKAAEHVVARLKNEKRNALAAVAGTTTSTTPTTTAPTTTTHAATTATTVTTTRPKKKTTTSRGPTTTSTTSRTPRTTAPTTTTTLTGTTGPAGFIAGA